MNAAVAGTRRHRHDERGLAAPAMVALTGVMLVVTLAAALLGGLLVERRQASAAADLAALAGAVAVQHRQDGCAAATRSVAHHGAVLLRCERVGERVRVTAAMPERRVLGRTVQVRAEAEAGPR